MSWDPSVAGSTSQSSNQAGFSRTGSNLVPSNAKSTSGNSGGFWAGPAKSINLLIDVTAVVSTPSMTLTVEWSHNNTDWFPADPVDSLGAAITAATKRARTVTVKASYFRVVWVITGGTAPTITFAVHAHYLDA